MRLSEKLYCIPILGLLIVVFCFNQRDFEKMNFGLLFGMSVFHILTVEILLFTILLNAYK